MNKSKYSKKYKGKHLENVRYRKKINFKILFLILVIILVYKCFIKNKKDVEVYTRNGNF